MDSPSFTRAVSFGPYEGNLRGLVHLLKYQKVLSAAPVLGSLAARAFCSLQDECAKNLLVIPVPLYRGKMRERGFNQSEVIARELIRRLRSAGIHELSLDIVALTRRRSTDSQVGMTREQRKQNLRGAFHVKDKTRVRGREVLLVDDVMTTGATVSECARVLRVAGAAQVWVTTPARAIRHDQEFTFLQGTEAAAFAAGGRA